MAISGFLPGSTLASSIRCGSTVGSASPTANRQHLCLAVRDRPGCGRSGESRGAVGSELSGLVPWRAERSGSRHDQGDSRTSGILGSAGADMASLRGLRRHGPGSPGRSTVSCEDRARPARPVCAVGPAISGLKASASVNRSASTFNNSWLAQGTPAGLLAAQRRRGQPRLIVRQCHLRGRSSGVFHLGLRRVWTRLSTETEREEQ